MTLSQDQHKSKMKTTPLLLGSLLAFTVAAAEPSKPAAFEVRLVLDSASPDSEKLTFTQQRSNGGFIHQHTFGTFSQHLQQGTNEGETAEEKLHVQKKPLLDRSTLQSAAAQKIAVSDVSEIQVTFTEQGAKRFAEVTRDHVGQRLAIMIDGKVYAAPKVMMEITGGKVVISGSFSEQEATDLVARLSQ